MLRDDAIYLGSARHNDDSIGEPQYLLLRRANRHGLVTGSTGTGKTVTLQALCEGFSRAGVPVFAADAKGDFSGIAAAGTTNPIIANRAKQLGIDATNESFPVAFWDIFGDHGTPIRTTMTAMGPTILARLMGLNTAQRGALYTLFKHCEDRKERLDTLSDLQAALAKIATLGGAAARYGSVSPASIGIIQRQLLILEMQGGAAMFGRPCFDVSDFMRTAPDGRGVVNVMASERLMQSPLLYSTFLLWLLSSLFDRLPEVGDQDRPKLVFFFDEAHMLFNDAPKALLAKIEQIVRLIRSKGVGVYFVTQSPQDVPDSILAQFGNRIQHALRAYTPKAQRAVRTAADTFRPNPEFTTSDIISSLTVGEALVSTLDAGGVPQMVQRTLVRPPASRIGPLDDAERAAVIAACPMAEKYRAAPAPATKEPETAVEPHQPVRTWQRDSGPLGACDLISSPVLSRTDGEVVETWRYEIFDGVMGKLWRRVTSRGGVQRESEWQPTRTRDDAIRQAEAARREVVAMGYREVETTPEPV